MLRALVRIQQMDEMKQVSHPSLQFPFAYIFRSMTTTLSIFEVILNFWLCR